MRRDFVQLAVEGVRHLHPYEPGKPIEDLERELGLSDTLKLASNENPLGPGAAVVQVLHRHASEVALYPDGNGFALKQAIAARHGVPVECITLGNGSNDVLELLARAFAAPGLEVVFSAHAFAVYPIVSRAVGATARIAPANPPGHSQPRGHDLQAMAALVGDDTRLVFVANPNNPTGTWLRSGALREFITGLPDHVLCVVDEAYAEYVEEPDYPDATTWLGDLPNLVVTRTFSKIFALAGLRVGYGLSNPQVADLLNRVRQPFNVNALAQRAAVAALNDETHVAGSREVNAQGLRQLSSGFRERALDFVPSVGNFILVDTGRDAVPVYDGLLRQGVIVRPVVNYGFPNHLRITVGTAEQNTRLLQALDRVLVS